MARSTWPNDSEVSRFLKEFQFRVASATNETEVRDAFKTALELHCKLNDLRLEQGRSDLRRNRVVMEFKDKGLFNGLLTSAKAREALRQLSEKPGYIYRQAAKDGRKSHEYIGVAIDGVDAFLVACDESGEWHNSSLGRVTSIAALLIQILRDDQRRALSVENVLSDFGPRAQFAQDLIVTLYAHLRASLRGPNEIVKVKMLFSEWRKLFEQATSMGRLARAKVQRHFKDIGLPQNVDPAEALFVLHTYNALLYKLLAAEILAQACFTNVAGFCFALVAESTDQTFSARLQRDIEHSQVFKDHGIRNFVEGSFFSWYTDAPPAPLLAAIRRLAGRLTEYLYPSEPTSLLADFIRETYEGLVPAVLRHNLGEFYTPRWLVEATLDRSGYRGDSISGKTFIDPCCGSGGFLIHAIGRYRKHQTSDTTAKRRLHDVLAHIVGFDLNPLAVMASRLNYLLAVVDLIKKARSVDIEVPVYLADAIYAPEAITVADKSIRKYEITTVLGDISLQLPEKLVQTPRAFDDVLEAMESHIASHSLRAAFESNVRALPSLKNQPVHAWLPHLCDMYNRVLALERKNWNRIWCRIIRNYFASIAVGQADFIVSNPPWVRWSELPEAYRDRIKPTCEKFSIFSRTPFFGGNELDISGMLSYAVTHRWLRDGGVLGFIITQIHFQAPSSEGWRALKLPDGTELGIEGVDDMTQVRPFRGLGNSPAIFTWTRGKATKYPVQYRRWSRKASAQIASTMDWKNVEKQLQYDDFEARPIAPDSRWSILPKGSLSLLKRLSGKGAYTGRKGVTTDLNGAYFVKIVGPGKIAGTLEVQNLPDMGKADVPARTVSIEAELLYPLLKGASGFGRLKPLACDLAVIVPNKLITGFIDKQTFAKRYPLAAKYFGALERSGNLLSMRSTYRTRMRGQRAPEYAIYNVGPYSFQPFKVVWAEMQGAEGLKTAVFGAQKLPHLGKKVIVPDHKVYFAAFDDEAEAFFVAGFLTSKLVKTFIDSFTVKLQVGAVLDKVSVPKFDSRNPDHIALSVATKRIQATGVEAEKIDALAAKIVAAMPRKAPVSYVTGQKQLSLVAEPAPRRRRRRR